MATMCSSGSGSEDWAAERTRRRQETFWPPLNDPLPERFSLAGLSCANGPERTKLRQALRFTLVGPAV